MRECVEAAWARPAMRVFQGHIPFGLSDLLPGDARYATVLRDPIERTLSHYREVVRSASRWHSDWVFLQHATRSPPSPELTLVECLSHAATCPTTCRRGCSAG
jgi:hypothetical protein